MINKIGNILKKDTFLSKSKNNLLAVSGGADSVCLFFVLKALRYNFEIAHCNFNLRGVESEKDEQFVRDLANKFGFRIHVKSFETEQYAKDKKLSIQMAARSLRYSWFFELLKINNLEFLITAHNKEDNIETFLINLIRGTGINGLTAMKIQSEKIIRPLIHTGRNEIEEYLRKEKIGFRNDSSNKDIKYLRNRIRHQLLPILQQINPTIKKTISDEILVFDGVSKIFNKEIDRIRKDVISEKNGVFMINIARVINLENLETILFELLKPFGFSQINQIISSLNSQSGKQFFSNKYHLLIDREYIFIMLIQNCNDCKNISDSIFRINKPIKMIFSISKEKTIDPNLNIAKFDFEKLSFPLQIRKWRYGDRFKPLGMNNFKKLSDFFVDEKYSVFDKNKQWLLCSGCDIVWIIGKRIDNRYKITNNTKKVYIAKFLKQD